MSEEPQSAEDYGEGIAYPEHPEQIPYTREDLIRDLQLRSTSLKPAFKKYIEAACLRKACKDAWVLFVDGTFDPNTILANNPDLERPIIDNRIAEIQLKIACDKIDIRQPCYVILGIIASNHFSALLTRTSGEKRERLLQEFLSSVRQRVEQGGLEQPEQLPSKKKGFFSFGE